MGRWRSRTARVVVAVFLVLVVLWNAQTLGLATVPDEADPAMHVTQMNQRWTMFAPEPLRTDGWYVVPGHLENGSTVDAFHRRPVTWDRPPDITPMYPNERWRKYLVNLWLRGYSEHRPLFADYLCRRWNDGRDHGELVNVTLYFMEQPSRPHAETEPIHRVRLGQYECERSSVVTE